MTVSWGLGPVSAKAETVSRAAARTSRTQKRRDFFVEMLLSSVPRFPAAVQKERREKGQFGCVTLKISTNWNIFYKYSNQESKVGMYMWASLHFSTRKQALSMTLSSRVPFFTASMTAGIWVR